MYFLVNLKSCHARVLNRAIRENTCPVELAQNKIFCIGPALLGVYCQSPDLLIPNSPTQIWRGSIFG